MYFIIEKLNNIIDLKVSQSIINKSIINNIVLCII